MQRANRLKTIISATQSPGGVRVADLAEATSTSQMTIRRDLDELERRGVLRRTHGGAVSLPTRGTRLPFAVRLDSNLDEKQAIADAAQGLIPDGASVIVDTGTTCTAVAQALAGRDLTVLALSVHVAAALGECPGVRIVTPGGLLDSDELAWEGHRAVQEVRDFRADFAILGVCAWDETGMTSTSAHDAEVKKSILEAAGRRLAVATADKIGTSATFRVGAGEQVDTLVTGRLPRDTRPWLRASGIETLETHANR